MCLNAKFAIFGTDLSLGRVCYQSGPVGFALTESQDRERKKTGAPLPAEWKGPLMQLQLFIQMLSGGADDQRTDTFSRRSPFPNRFLFKLTLIPGGGFSCHLILEGSLGCGESGLRQAVHPE